MKLKIFLILLVFAIVLTGCKRDQRPEKGIPKEAAAPGSGSGWQQQGVTLEPWGTVYLEYTLEDGDVTIALKTETEEIISYYPESAKDMKIQGINIALEEDINGDGHQDLTCLIGGVNAADTSKSMHRVISLIHNGERGFTSNVEWDQWISSKLPEPDEEEDMAVIHFIVENLNALSGEYIDW